MSDGSSSTAVSRAAKAWGSPPPVSRTMVSVFSVKRPAGATMRLHQFPKLSR